MERHEMVAKMAELEATSNPVSAMKRGSTMVTRRSVVAGLASLSGAGVLGACGGAGEAPAAVAGPVEIEFWKSFAEAHRFSLIDDAVIKGYQAKNPGKMVRIGAVNTGWDDKLKTALAGGTPPNIILALQSAPVEYLSLGATLDLEAELKGNRVWGRVKGELIPLVLDLLRWKGRLGGLPGLVAYEGLGINTELLKKHGLATPKKDWTWDDYVELGRKVAKPDETWLGMQQFLRFNYWHEANLGYNANREQTKVTVDAPQNIEALEFKVAQVRTRRLETDVASPPGAATGSQYTWFGQGQQLTQIVNPGALTPPRFPGIPIEVINHPHGPSNKKKEISLSGASYAYMVFKASDPNKQRVAAELALHAVTEEQQVENVRAGGDPPSNLAALKSPAFTEAVRALARTASAAMDPLKYLTDYYTLAPYIYPLPTFPGWANALTIQGEYMARAAKGEMAPREALREAQPRMQAILDRALG